MDETLGAGRTMHMKVYLSPTVPSKYSGIRRNPACELLRSIKAKHVIGQCDNSSLIVVL